MTTPFRDHHDDADRLDEMLDAMRGGRETTGEAGGLADAASRFREMADRAAGAAPETTFDAIWEDLMHAHAVPTPMSGNQGATRAVPRAAHRVPEAHGLPEMGRWRGLLSAAIVVLMLAGMVAVAWTLRDGGGTPEDERAGILSAPTALDATAGASPEAANDWTAWVTPEECTAEPMSDKELTEILSGTADHADRSYTVAGPASPETAQAAVDSARTWRACAEYDMDDARRGIETDAFIRMSEANRAEPQPGFLAERAERGEEISAHLEMLTAADFVVTTTVDPPEALRDKWEGNTTGPVPIVNSHAYNPKTAVVFDDERVLVPQTTLMWDADPSRTGMSNVTTSLQPITGQALILANEDGVWKVDDLLYVCLGDCDAFWAGFVETDATAGASPAASINWLTWVMPGECTAEPMTTEAYAEVMREEPDISGRSYEVVGPADPAMAADAATAARAHEACKVYGTTSQQRAFETPAYIFFRSVTENRTISVTEMETMDYEHGRLLSETMPAKEPGAYAEILEETPPDDLIGYMRRQRGPTMPTVFLSLTYDPANAATLADGRVAIPATILYWSGGDPDEWRPVEQWQIDDSTSLYTYVVILDEEDGAWKVDEQLGFCPFEGCADLWAEMAPAPTGTPVATPEG